MSRNGGGGDAGNHTEPLKYFRRNAAFELAGVKVTAVYLENTGLTAFSLTLAEPTNLCQVAAIIHDTPLSAAVAACVQKEPSAIVATTLPYPRQIPRSQQLCR